VASSGSRFIRFTARTASFYVYYTRQTDGTVVVSEFLVSAASADLADAATERQVLTVTTRSPITTAATWRRCGRLSVHSHRDGAGGGDPNNNAQT